MIFHIILLNYAWQQNVKSVIMLVLDFWWAGIRETPYTLPMWEIEIKRYTKGKRQRHKLRKIVDLVDLENLRSENKHSVKTAKQYVNT